MADIGGSGNSFEGKDSVTEQTRSQREAYITNQAGDAVGSNFVVPKADFGKFLGYDLPKSTEKDPSNLAGGRVIELALQKEMQEIGLGAAKNGTKYENIGISWGRFNNEPGREKDMIKDGVDAIRQGPEKDSLESKVKKLGSMVTPYYAEVNRLQQDSHNDNIKYLEMQYKFQEMSKQQGTISNLMKTRHETVSRTIRGGQG